MREAYASGKGTSDPKELHMSDAPTHSTTELRFDSSDRPEEVGIASVVVTDDGRLRVKGWHDCPASKYVVEVGLTPQQRQILANALSGPERTQGDPRDDAGNEVVWEHREGIRFVRTPDGYRIDTMERSVDLTPAAAHGLALALPSDEMAIVPPRGWVITSQRYDHDGRMFATLKRSSSEG